MTDTKKFQRRVENFTCGNCDREVVGDGFTNHCPHCLVSRHVDINPGDRAATCGGLMPPVGMEMKGGETILLHRCKKCGHERKNKLAPNDDLEHLRALCREGFPLPTK